MHHFATIRPAPAAPPTATSVMWWLFIPLLILGVILVLMLALLLLGRYKNGALLRPLITRLSRIGFRERLLDH